MNSKGKHLRNLLVESQKVLIKWCRWWRKTIAKGANENVVKNTMNKEYLDVLFNKKW